MYDYVRRQQELQPALFLSKTFHWMEPSARQPSWTHKYSRSLARDPLAHSSSSLFTGGVVGGASPARTLFAFRRTRQRQVSDAAVQRPPSGVSGTFVARRRGFTAPAGVRAVAELGHPSANINNAMVHDSAEEVQVARAGDQTAEANHDGSVLFSSAPQRSGISPPTTPHLQTSSFSPPLSPQPRTICHRARSLMQRVRMLKPDGPRHARRQQKQHRRRYDEQQQGRSQAPFTISSVLCTFDNGTLPRGGQKARQPAVDHRSAPVLDKQAPAPAPHTPVSPRSPVQPTRRLPRSPLANPPSITSISSSSSSEDEETAKCQNCARYRGTELIITCASHHALCYGCVQAHVRSLANHQEGAPVRCLLSSCESQIPRAQLRLCVPPQRMRQLDGARPPTRYPQAANGEPTSDDEGFDAPLAPDHEEEDLGVTRSLATLSVSTDVHARASASMPVLGGTANNTAERASRGSSAEPLMSERTCVGRASADSVVAAAARAADSCESLSPRSVGSRLRRVPKAHEPLAPQIDPPTEYLPESLAHLACLRSADAMHEDARASGVFCDYDGLERPVQARHDALSFASTGSPVSWQQPPPLPPPLAPGFRSSATWMTPEQRHSGYAENMLLSATLFETIRRKPSPETLDGDDEDMGFFDLDACSLVGAESPLHGDHYLTPQATPGVASTLAPTPVVARRSPDDERGVYIPTWRRPEAAGVKLPMWAAHEFGDQSGVLCEAAELNFDLYETLHRRR